MSQVNEKKKRDWTGLVVLITIVVLLMGFNALMPMNPGPPPGWKPSVVHAAPQYSDWEVKTMPFIKRCECRVGATTEYFALVDRDTTLRAYEWAESRQDRIQVLRVEKRWDTVLAPDDIPIFTITVHYLEVEK